MKIVEKVIFTCAEETALIGITERVDFLAEAADGEVAVLDYLWIIKDAVISLQEMKLVE